MQSLMIVVVLAAIYAGCFVLAAAWLMGSDGRPKLLAAFLIDAAVGFGGVAAVALLWSPGPPARVVPPDAAGAGLLWVAAVLAGSVSALACWLAASAREEGATTETAMAGTLGLTMLVASLCAAASVMAPIASA